MIEHRLPSSVSPLGRYLAAFGCAGCVALYGQPLIHDNNEAMQVLVSVFSVLAGFLIAIITMVGDASLLSGRSWAAAVMGRKQIEVQLAWHKLLFWLYLLTLGLIFAALLVGKIWPTVLVWLEGLVLFVSTLSFIASMGLPSTLMRVQMDMLDREIAARTQAAEPTPSTPGFDGSQPHADGQEAALAARLIED